MSFKIFNHLGSFLFLAATIFLIVTTVSAPVANSFGLMTVTLPEDVKGSSVVFGSFGYCIKDGARNGDDLCSDRHIGYNPAELMRNLTDVSFGDYEEDTTEALTRVMVLHPVCVALCFLTFLISFLSSTVIGSVISSGMALLSFLITGIAIISDFVLFTIIRKNVNSEKDGGNAYFSSALWTALVAEICLLFGMIIVLLACCTNRMHKRRAAAKAEQTSIGAPAPKKKFWQRK
ncbi:hypothetical protein TD95_005417 [Thielaviopsis punctulata]|uniref:Pali-domain-containing protein n=1 Tax=Thielaviopsis punctulata TaxID=72032 RepID=A0A0F4Z9L4_9PEZI|nr:hypothetical protein TD95_005417 [Thielaviopsis punctulata]